VTTLTAPDGSTVSATLAGDEYAHYYISEADNTIYTLDTRGLAVATTPDDIAQLRQRNLEARHPAQAKAKAPQARIGMSDRLSDYCIESLGDLRIPVILVDYRDLAFTHGDDARATFTDFFQEGEKSARQYMLDNSNGRFRPQFDIYGPYHLSKNMSYYGGNDDYGNDKAVGEMVAEACQLATEVDFSQYDNNGDGYCDAVIVIYAGNGEAQSGKKSSVWPCQWSLTESEYNKTLTLNGVKIDKFAVFNELNGSSSTKIDGIGTFAHEFSHVLGLPDYYSTNPYASYFGMGSWSLMDYGCYADNGYTPAGYTAYDKMTLGWIDDIPEPEPASHLTLTPMNQGSAETDQAYRLIGENEDEYYVLEN
ncbi:MAG: M6 family metalloprotease domain-containing protein, partial [Muribaculaceae bacterium]|nr:M6 family metalloprotease domain-containing protein [Muribaculaceae bacterium]